MVRRLCVREDEEDLSPFHFLSVTHPGKNPAGLPPLKVGSRSQFNHPVYLSHMVDVKNVQLKPQKLKTHSA